jgi:hypothetical protein
MSPKVPAREAAAARVTHALVGTVDGLQLQEAHVAQHIAATVAEECLSGVVEECGSWYCSTSCLAGGRRSALRLVTGAAMLWRPSPSVRLSLAIVRDGSCAQLAVEIKKRNVPLL